MITVYEKEDSKSGEMRQHAFEVEGDFLIPSASGCRPVFQTKFGMACTCEKFLQTGYCEDTEKLDLIKHSEYGFKSRQIRRAIIRNMPPGVVWILTDNIYSVSNGKCKCIDFRTRGTCEHVILAKD